MALHGISEAARLAGKTRQTLHKDLKSGKLSSTPGADGRPKIETSELERVYGSLQRVDDAGTVKVDDAQQVALQVAQARLEAADETIRLLKDQLAKAEEREAKGLEIIARQTLLLPAPKPEPAPETPPPAAQDAPGSAEQVAPVGGQRQRRKFALWRW